MPRSRKTSCSVPCKGNVQQVTALLNGQEVKRFIKASPQYKTINVYDDKFKPNKRETLLRPEKKQEESLKEGSKERQKGNKKEQPPEGEPEKKQTRRKGLSL